MRSALLILLCLALPATAATSRRQLNFTAGGETVAGLLELPAREAPHPVILFAADDGPVTKEAFIASQPTNALHQAHHAIGRWDRFTRLGFGCFAWDKPGTGQSTGKWQPDTAAARAAEILAAIDTLKQTPGIDANRIGLWCNAQAARALGDVLAKTTNIAFVIAVAPPVQTPLETSAEQLRAELKQRGVATALSNRAVNLLLRKWEMLRSGIPYAALTKHIAEKRLTLGDADHPWLAPFTPDEFAALTGPRRAAVEAWFDAPFTRLLHLPVPVLACLDHDAAPHPFNSRRHPNLTLRHFSEEAGSAAYWRALEDFFAAHFPAIARRPHTVFKSTAFTVADLAVNLNFLDERTIAHELNLTDLARRALSRYIEIFGGPPRDAAGAPRQNITINVDHGQLAAPGRVDLTLGPRKLFGYLDWRTTFLHELAHLWIGQSFAPANEQEEWFNEGATEYLAIKTAIRLGIIPAADATKILTRSWANYLSARGIGEVSLRDAGRAGKREYFFLLYHGGLTTSMILDYEIRRHTDNQRGLDHLFRLLYAERQYDANSLIRHLRALTQTDFTQFFRRHIAGNRIIPVGQYITRLEVEALTTGQAHKLPTPDRQILQSIFESPSD